MNKAKGSSDAIITATKGHSTFKEMKGTWQRCVFKISIYFFVEILYIAIDT